MSSRAIASATGIPQPTVARDLRAGEASASPAPITGTDGKAYAPRLPQPSPVVAPDLPASAPTHRIADRVRAAFRQVTAPVVTRWSPAVAS
jgi:hypothetical protein